MATYSVTVTFDVADGPNDPAQTSQAARDTIAYDFGDWSSMYDDDLGEFFGDGLNAISNVRVTRARIH